MGLSRRQFLKVLSAGTCGAAVHQALSPMMAFGVPFAAATGPLPVLILVNLAGGCSYNIAPPYAGLYLDQNPTIGYRPDGPIASQGLTIANDQGLHPALTGFKALFDEGQLALVNMVGYPNPNRSHDESTQIWFRGMRAGSNSTGGWGARLTCQTASMFGGVSLGGSNLLIQGDCNPPRAFGDLDNFGENGFWGGADGTKWLRDTRDTLISTTTPSNESYTYVQDSMSRLEQSLATLKQETSARPPGTFPNTSFGQQCQDAARLIYARSLSTQFIYLEHGGFDTHSDEKIRLTQLLTDLNGGLTALANSLKAMGRWSDVTIITMSEFSRTFENGSAGTDHGHAAAMYVMGGKVKGGIKSPAPTNADVAAAEGYFHNYHVDFREPFVMAVRNMGLDPGVVFPEGYNAANLDLFW